MTDNCSYCMRRLSLQMPIRCVVNPRMGVESRNGRPPPLDRVIKAPIEAVMLKLVTSRAFMKDAMTLRGGGGGH